MVLNQNKQQHLENSNLVFIQVHKAPIGNSILVQ